MSLPVSVTSSKSSTVSYEYDFRGNRTKMTDSTGVTACSYSPLSELVSETHGNILKSYSYDKNSARTAFTLSKGGTALLSNTYVNTNTGMLKSMQSGTDTVSYNYDLNKNMTSEVINNALTHSVTYNKHNSVKTAENKFGNAVHSSYSYEVLKNGNVSSVSETLAGVSRQRAFDYDGIGRLKKETDGTNEISYTYDASGNRLTFDKTALPQRSYGYLPGNISWYSTSNNAFAEYTHDNNGNILSKTGNRVTDYTMTYDGFNRLVSAAVEGGSSASYEYNGDGLRTAKTAKGTRTDFIWDGDRLVCEISGESVTVYKYGNRLFGFEKDGVKKYYNFNGHGDVTGITDSAYTLIKSYEYDAFGVEKNPDPGDTNPFRYCAEYYDTETGYIYLRARYYDVKDGRFISEDPAKDGLNWYVYCGNNPLTYVDPTGFKSIVFYANGMKEQANVRKTIYEQKYGTECYIYRVDSAEAFTIGWNNLSYWGSTPIDAVEIICHGSALQDSAHKNGTGYLFFGNNHTERVYARPVNNIKSTDRSVQNLWHFDIKELNINACNSANKDIYNVALAFSQKIDYKIITGWDGGAQWDASQKDHIRGEGKEINNPIFRWYYVKKYQHTWWNFVPKKSDGSPAREREGKVVYQR